jgi:uncharacterized protein (TIGR02147 family)
METMSYRTIMREELDFRIKSNPNYSLRAFARDLSINPSQLSDVLKGKIGVSSKKALDIAAKIGLNQKESLLFKAMVEVEHGRTDKIIEEAKKIIAANSFSEKFNGLTLDGFKIISDWHYFAILSTMELDQFDGTTQFLANKLNLPISTIDESIKRLLKMDLVDLKDGKFYPTGIMLTTTHDIQSSALKKFHKSHIAKSVTAIDEIAVELRDITSMTMAIDLDKMKEAKEMIKNFRRQFCQVMESGKKNQVYNLNIQFIPLTKMD